MEPLEPPLDPPLSFSQIVSCTDVEWKGSSGKTLEVSITVSINNADLVHTKYLVYTTGSD